MAMPETANNIDYYRRVRSLEARQEFLRAVRGVDSIPNPYSRAIRVERPTGNGNGFAESPSPRGQSVTIFEETTK